MLKYTAMAIVFLSPALSLASEVSYAEISKSMLNSGFLRSPVYAKSFYRDMRASDTADYNNEIAKLKELKDKRLISPKAYKKQKEEIDSAYQKAYGQENIMQKGAEISQNPADSFYDAVMNNPSRVNLKIKTNKELLENMQQGSASQISEKTTPIVTVAEPAKGKRGLEAPARSRAPIGSMAAEPKQTSEAYPVISTSRKKALGEKSIPVNLSAFK